MVKLSAKKVVDKAKAKANGDIPFSVITNDDKPTQKVGKPPRP